MFKHTKKPKDLPSFKTPKDEEFIREKKIKFINYVGVIGALILILYGFANLYIEDYVIGIVEFILALNIFYALWGIKKTNNIELYSSIGLVSIFVISINNFTGGGFEETGLFWIYVYPLVVFFLKGTKDGITWMLGFFAVVIFFTLASAFGYYNLPYEDFTVQMFVISLVLISVFVYVYQKTQESSQMVISVKNRDLEKVNIDLMSFQKVVENTIDGIIFLDQHINITYANAAFLEITKMSYAQTLGKNLEEFFTDKENYTNVIEKKIYLKEVLNIESEISNKNLESTKLQIEIYPIFYLNVLNFYVAIFRDSKLKVENLTSKTYSKEQQTKTNNEGSINGARGKDIGEKSKFFSEL